MNNITDLVGCSRKGASAGVENLVKMGWVSPGWVTTESVGKTHIAGFRLIGCVTGRLFGIGKGPFAFTLGVAIVVVGNRRGLSGRNDDRG